jgi:lysophospholipase L1-like esterase
MNDEAPEELSTGRLWFLRLALAAIGFLLVVASIEGLGRVYIWWRHGVPGKSYGLWQYDKELGAIHAGNAYNTHTQTNSDGFRGREDVIEPKPPGSLRVIAYGGSTTYCYNLADGDTWPERLQARLRSRPGHERDQVLNGGHISWSLSHLYLQAKRDIPRLKPDLVILYAGVNETTNEGYLALAGQHPQRLLRERRFGVAATNLDQCRWLKRHSVTMRFLDYAIKSKVKAALPESRTLVEADHGDERVAGWKESWAWQNYAIVLRQMIDLVHRNGGQTLFVAEAGAKTFQDHGFLRFSAEGLQVARDCGAATCDPRPAFARSKSGNLFYETGVHVSPEGAQLLSSEIFRAIEEMDRGGYTTQR